MTHMHSTEQLATGIKQAEMPPWENQFPYMWGVCVIVGVCALHCGDASLSFYFVTAESQELHYLRQMWRLQKRNCGVFFCVQRGRKISYGEMSWVSLREEDTRWHIFTHCTRIHLHIDCFGQAESLRWISYYSLTELQWNRNSAEVNSRCFWLEVKCSSLPNVDNHEEKRRKKKRKKNIKKLFFMFCFKYFWFQTMFHNERVGGS